MRAHTRSKTSLMEQLSTQKIGLLVNVLVGDTRRVHVFIHRKTIANHEYGPKSKSPRYMYFNCTTMFGRKEFGQFVGSILGLAEI